VSSRRSPGGDTLTASEIGRYAYCARAWWLQRVCGVAPQNRSALAAGRRRHGAHGHEVRVGARQAAWARRLALVAVVLAVVLIGSLMGGPR